MEISDFEWYNLHCGHISSFQFRNRLQMTKTKKCSEISDQCPISNSDHSFISDNMSEITDFNGFCNSKTRRVRKYYTLVSGQKFLIDKKDVVEQNFKKN